MKKHSVYTIVGVMVMALFLSLETMWAANIPYITNRGIGKVKIGATISKLPNSIDGVYDRIEFASEEDYDEDGSKYTYEVYHAFLGNNVTLDIFPNYLEDEEKVGGITIYSAALKTKSGLCLNSTPSELFAAGGEGISFNDGSVAIVCGGVLFFDMPLSDQGFKKSEQAYFGKEVQFDDSDFDTSGHPFRIVLNGEELGTSTSKISLKDIILISLLLVVALAIIGHMIYVNYGSDIFPENTIPLQGTDLNNSFVISRMDNLYNNVFTFYKNPDDITMAEPLKYPVGAKAASEAKKILNDIYNNHMPVGGKAAEKLRNVSILTNEACKRTFSGSSKYLVITVIIGFVVCFLNKYFAPLIYFLPACVLYYYSCMTPNYIKMERELKASKRSKFMDGIFGRVFGMAEGSMSNKKKDTPVPFFTFALSIILFLVLAYAILFVGILNYIRNYILR